ncbi:hypothetical protein AY601_1604 [Pedobacter cryoconitis]|uniref:OmpA-like domain-containing protein n=1 Tax=Pedobacter cryoconitis TaxID=188932 RepID=A0A127VBC5_9SPHI|nr:OmpA family protein [Pedobacter cryoconitis]AMP98519.1 hypothetical protein AY601_1604 [Pedobacter cryoconitis]
MAFDLNKNEGTAAKDPAQKAKGSSKFDLSKKETAETVVTVDSSKSKTWIIGLIGILIIGSGTWYYSSKTKIEKTIHNASTQAVQSDLVATVKTETQPKIQADVVASDTAVATSTTNQIKSTVENGVGDKNTVNLNHKIPVSFGQGSSKFTRINQTLVKKIISYLSENPTTSIQINGYASSEGALAVNQTISQARADAFKKLLVSNNIAENRIVATGKGIENPIASNDSNIGRKKNRRVEITLP